MTCVELIQKRLKDNGYKLTNQRKAIIEVLFENKGQFLTAQEIFILSRNKCEETNFSTVYRNLDILINTGIVHNTKINNDASVYELKDAEGHNHQIICKGCGKTETIDYCPLEAMDVKVKNKNFILTDHKFELYGYCNECDKKNNNK